MKLQDLEKINKIDDEGRLVVESVLQATEEGLGNGETPIFPIHIFKIKEKRSSDSSKYRITREDNKLKIKKEFYMYGMEKSVIMKY